MNQSISFTVQDILNATGGELLFGDQTNVFGGVSIDSREINKEEFFVAIVGENHDGHSFIKDIIQKDVRGFLIEKKHSKEFALPGGKDKQSVFVAVDNTTKALGRLATFQRKRSGVNLIAVTGSSGKTTTRSLISSVMEQKFSTLSTMGNYNNEIGLPLTLLQLEKGHEWAVVEVGMNHIGEIRDLARICLPDIGVITNIGPAHLEGVGSIEGVMQAKGELLSEINPGGTAVLNADDPRILKLSENAGTKVLFYGLSEKAAIRGDFFKQEGHRIRFTLILPDEEISVDFEACGDFMVSNSLAAAAAGHLAGLPAAVIKEGIEKFQPIKGRMNIHRLKNGINLIDDTYNANPDSVKSAIRSFTSLKNGKRGVLVLGDMFELGEHSEEMHKKIGEFAAEAGISRLFATGRFSESVAEGARLKEMNQSSIFTGSRKEILVHLKKGLEPGDWVLVKGSRAMKMEDIVEGLTEEFLVSGKRIFDERQ